MNRINVSPIDFLAQSVSKLEGDELREFMSSAVKALAEGKTPLEFAEDQEWSNGVSGYINHSVPAALYCWAFTPKDFRRCVENAVLLGGDTDSVAAMTGAVCGANLGSESLPNEWLDSLAEWPRNSDWMKCLARTLSECLEDNKPLQPPSMRWLATLPRNLAFATVVFGIGFRRLPPPY